MDLQQFYEAIVALLASVLGIMITILGFFLAAFFKEQRNISKDVSDIKLKQAVTEEKLGNIQKWVDKQIDPS